MRQFLVWMVLAPAALTAGCANAFQNAPRAQPSPNWRFPCSYRAFDAGFCDNLNGLPYADFQLQRRILEGL
jgi:hypothetical protein